MYSFAISIEKNGNFFPQLKKFTDIIIFFGISRWYMWKHAHDFDCHCHSLFANPLIGTDCIRWRRKKKQKIPRVIRSLCKLNFCTKKNSCNGWLNTVNHHTFQFFLVSRNDSNRKRIVSDHNCMSCEIKRYLQIHSLMFDLALFWFLLSLCHKTTQ